MKRFRYLSVFIWIFGFHQLAVSGVYEDFLTAVRLGQTRTVQSLLARGMDPNTVNEQGVSAIFGAIQTESWAVAEALAAHPRFRPNVRNSAGETPIMLAALRGQMPLVKALLAREADINHPGWTPLHYAATGGHTAIVELLLEESAYIDAASPNGTTPVMIAARYGNDRVVKVLIEAGADLFIKNEQGLMALDFARALHNEASTRLILKSMVERPR